MIHFFRRIRQKLLSENRITRYLIYAIGEIALVMIGILLALQVNNWNEGRKNAKKEIVYLNNFKNDLELDIERQKVRQHEIADKISAFKIIDPSFEIRGPAQHAIRTDINIDSLSLWDVFSRGKNNRFVRGTYDALKDNGDIRLLRNEELYLNIIQLYNNHTEAALSLYQDLKSLESILRHKYAKELKYSDIRSTFFSHPDKEEIIAELSNYYEIFALRYDHMSVTIKDMQETLDLIEAELKQ